jgi:hypothetical protein
VSKLQKHLIGGGFSLTDKVSPHTDYLTNQDFSERARISGRFDQQIGNLNRILTIMDLSLGTTSVQELPKRADTRCPTFLPLNRVSFQFSCPRQSQVLLRGELTQETCGGWLLY